MRLFLLAVSILLFKSQTCSAQTKLIAHKSHSGKTSDFHKAMKYTHSDFVSSNFGMAPRPTIKYAQLDTLRYISDSMVIMTTSNYCINRYTDSSRLWSAGVDTLYNHPLFSKKNALDTIKKELKETYFFKNSVDSVVFMGYESIQKSGTENKRDKTNEKEETYFPVILDKDGLTPLDIKSIGLSIILALALIIAFAYRSIHSPKRSFEKN